MKSKTFTIYKAGQLFVNEKVDEEVQRWLNMHNPTEIVSTSMTSVLDDKIIINIIYIP